VNLADRPTVRPLPEQVKGSENRQHRMNRTRLSLLYSGSYLFTIVIGLLFAPRETLKILQSNGDYGDVFPRGFFGKPKLEEFRAGPDTFVLDKS